MKLITPLLAILLAGCTTIVDLPPPNCTEQVPKRWAEEIAGAPLPDFAYIDSIREEYPELAEELEKREWQKFGVANAGLLQQSENRRQDTMTIITTCENNYKRAVEKTEKRWFEFWK